MGMPSYGFGFGMDYLNKLIPNSSGRSGGYGASLKKDVRRFYGATVGFAGRGESVPQWDNYCEIDPDTKDKFGIPVLRFNYKWTDDEVNQAKQMVDTIEEMMHNMIAVPLSENTRREREEGVHKSAER